MDALLDRARVMEEAGRGADKRIVNSGGARVSTYAGIGVYANSHGFVGQQRSTAYSQSCVLVARDGAGMQRDHDYDSRHSWDDLHSPADTGTSAARRTVRRLGAGSLATGRMPVLFAPEVARSLIGHLVAAVSGGNLYRRSSFLLDAQVRQPLAVRRSVYGRPLGGRGARSAACESEGVATTERPLIEAGVLSG